MLFPTMSVQSSPSGFAIALQLTKARPDQSDAEREPNECRSEDRYTAFSAEDDAPKHLADGDRDENGHAEANVAPPECEAKDNKCDRDEQGHHHFGRVPSAEQIGPLHGEKVHDLLVRNIGGPQTTPCSS